MGAAPDGSRDRLPDGVPDRLADGASGSVLPSDAPVGTLRGAGVDIDARLAGRVLAALVIAILLVVAVVLFVAGANKNAQISSLRDHGVPVTVTVTGCVGLLGGSGSNFAGYACRGSFTVDGRHYNEDIPGNSLRATGQHVQGVTTTDDPGLLSTAGAVADERPSDRVFVLPIVLVAVVALAVGALAWRRRARRRLSL